MKKIPHSGPVSTRHLRRGGFSTIELMIAFALMSLVFGGVILAHFGSSYWAIAAETSNEGLYKAKTKLEELRAIVKKDFRMASSSPFAKISDTSCDSGSLCYFVTTNVTDLSPCSKYVEARIDWQVQSYPTTTTSLFTNLTDANEAVSLGGDCPLTLPSGAWVSTTQFSSASGAAQPTAIDVLGGVSYIVSNQLPYFSEANSGGFVTFLNSFATMDGFNNVDVARDVSTGRTYAYAAIASTTVALEVVDVTDINNPSSVAKVALNGVDKMGSQPQGWRVAYYGTKVYITTRETDGPEFHIIDVSNPGLPVELGSRELNTSVYGMVVREVKQGSVTKRLAFLSTSSDTKEFMLLDVTSPTAITEINSADFPGTADSRSIFLSGNMVYLGRVSNAGPELYSLDVSNMFGTLSVVSGDSREIGGDVESIRVADPFVFVANTRSGRELQVWNTNDAGVLSPSELSHTAVSGFAGGADLEGNRIYITSGSNPRLRVIQSQ